STGRPKGVVLPETTLTNLVRNQAHLSSGRRMRTLQYMPPSFDVFTLEVFGTLCTGGALVVPSPSARTDFGELAALLADERVERVYLPYVALCELAAVLRTSPLRLTALREVYVTGEALVITDDLRTMFRRCPDARLINAYGPSEAHLCTEDRLPADPATWPALPSIGRVVPGVDAYVVGRDHGDAERSDPVIRPLPFGVEGELCVAGPVVSTGYLGLPDTTRAVMVPDPFTPGQRMYRTGDVVLLTPDGRLHYRGRADQQVKIRGYRIEPGEVEAALERTLGAEAAVVLAVTTGTERALHAFVRSRERIPADWRSRLGSVVPNYMIPRGITRLDTIPVTANGKTDHRALEALIGSDDAPGKAPDCPGWDGAVTGSERAIARLWAEVLGGPPPGPEADFFSVGGHSLVAARLHRLVRERLDADVPLSALLSTPTVRGMARSLDHPGASAAVNLREEARLHDLDVRDRREPTGDMVLLTGATGFLGSQLLCELRRAGRRVGCLIRADGVEEGRRRLREALRTFDLPESLLAGTEILPGDLTRPGLGPGGWGERLADEVSEVYHAAAHINFAVPYRTVRQTNVDGLRELLDVCGANRTPLRLISTMGVFPPDSTSGVVREDTVPGDPESLGIGYSQSKWVAERLALEAGRAGLPVTVHRVGRIAGHSRTGACRHDDFFWLQLKGFAMLGCYPEDILDAPAVDLLPVDYVARAVVGLSTDGPADGIWHLHHPRGLTWRTVIERIRAEGYAVSPTDRPTWMSALERQAGTEGHGRRQGLGSLVPLMREGVMRLGRFGVDNTFTQNALFAAGCPIPPADPALIHRMFEYFRRLGALPSPGRDERRGLDA
ncbi:MAG: hypothetical protein QG622_1355, partial [Actinomycetota bacterium]|nr:hypothetical protein [Actinomycetota bacterium]